MDHSDRIKLLEQTVIQLNSVIENLSASTMVLSARLAALRRIVTQSLTQLGFSTPDHPTLPAAIDAMEREACHNQLAHVSDSDPRLAGILKSMIDQVTPD